MIIEKAVQESIKTHGIKGTKDIFVRGFYVNIVLTVGLIALAVAGLHEYCWAIVIGKGVIDAFTFLSLDKLTEGVVSLLLTTVLAALVMSVSPLGVILIALILISFSTFTFITARKILNEETTSSP